MVSETPLSTIKKISNPSILVSIGFLVFCILDFYPLNSQEYPPSIPPLPLAEAHRVLSVADGEKRDVGNEALYLSVDKIQRDLLEEDLTLLEYFVEEDRIYIFFFTKIKFEKAIVPLDFPLTEWVSFIQKELKSPSAEAADFYPILHNLYTKIWQPIEQFQPDTRIIIKAGNVLKEFPFEVLLSKKYQPQKDLPDFLIRKHSFCYTNNLYEYNFRKAVNFSPKKGLLILDDMDSELNVGGDQATSQSMTIDRWNSYKMIHWMKGNQISFPKELAAHLIVVNTYKELPSNKSVKALIANWWQTDHSYAMELQSGLYRYLFKDHTPDLALHYAKNNYLYWQDRHGQHPHYWSAMQLSGVVVLVAIRGFRWDLLFLAGLVWMLFGGWYLLEKGIV